MTILEMIQLADLNALDDLFYRADTAEEHAAICLREMTLTAEWHGEAVEAAKIEAAARRLTGLK